MIGELIYTSLSTDSAVASIVGSRIYPLKGDQEAVLPAVIYVVESEINLDPAAMTRHSEFDVRLSLYGNNYLELDSLSTAVQNAIENATAPDGYTFEAAYLVDLDDGIDEEIQAYSKDIIMKILTHKNI